MTKRSEAPSDIGVGPGSRRAFRLPGLPYYWENFFASLILHLSLPLLPLAIEQIQTGGITEKSLTLAAAMYTISIGVSSRSRLMFAMTVAASIFYAFLYGIVISKSSPDSVVGQASVADHVIRRATTLGIISVFLAHAGERFNRHVVDRAPFLEFMSN